MALHALTDREMGFSGLYAGCHHSRYICSHLDDCLIVDRKQEPVPPLSCKFATVFPYYAAVADEDGGIMLFNTLKRGPDRLLKEWQGHNNAIFDVDWTPGEACHLVTCVGDQTVTLWNTERETKVVVMKGHKSSVKTVQYLYSSNAVLASGSRDGRILIWDTRVSKKGDAVAPVNAITNAHCSSTGSTSKESQHSVTAVVFQDDNTLISAGSGDRNIRVWDLRKNYTVLKNAPVARETITHTGNSTRTRGYSSLVLDSSRSRLFANCLDNTIYEFSLASPSTPVVSKFRGHQNSTFFIRSSLSHDDRFLITGSSDGNAYIYSVDWPASPPWLLCGHSDEVSHGLWHPADPGTLVTFGDDCRFRTWRLRGEEEPVDALEIVGYAELAKLEPAKPSCLFSPSKVLRATHSPRRPSLLSPAAKLAISRLGNSASLSFTSYRRSLAAKRRASLPLRVANGLPTPKKLTVTPLKSKPADVDSMHSSASVAKRKLYDDDDANLMKKLKNGEEKQGKEAFWPLGGSQASSPSFVNSERAGKHCPLLANIPNLVFEGGVSRVAPSFNLPTPPPSRSSRNWLDTLSSSKRKRLAEINGDAQRSMSMDSETARLAAPDTLVSQECCSSDGGDLLLQPSSQSLSGTPKSQAAEACGGSASGTRRTPVGSGSRSKSSQGSKKTNRPSEKAQKSVKNILMYFRPQQ